METKKLNPVFDDLNNPATILNHIEELKHKSEGTGYFGDIVPPVSVMLCH